MHEGTKDHDTTRHRGVANRDHSGDSSADNISSQARWKQHPAARQTETNPTNGSPWLFAFERFLVPVPPGFRAVSGIKR